MNFDAINNKIISIETILKIAEYLEVEKEHYGKLYAYNEKLKYYRKHKVDIFRGVQNNLNYKIVLHSGEELKKDDFEWFKEQLKTIDKFNIKEIDIIFLTSSYSNKKNNNELLSNSESRRIAIYLYFNEDKISYSFEGSEYEEEIYKYKSDILKILENCPNRYDKTIKRKFLRVESLSLVIGFICAYVTMLAMIIFSNNLPDAIKKMMNNSKYSYIVVFYIITIGIGNIIGGIISNGLYKNIAPKKKYSHYSKSSGKSVYIDDIEGYMKLNEVQIGKFYNTIQQRAKIEKIFKFTNIIVIIQLILSCIYCMMI